MRTTNSARVRATSGDRRNGADSRNSDSLSRTRDIVSQVAGSSDFRADDFIRGKDRSRDRNRNEERPNSTERGGNGPAHRSQGNRNPSNHNQRSVKTYADFARDESRSAAQSFERDRRHETAQDRTRSGGRGNSFGGAGQRGDDSRSAGSRGTGSRRTANPGSAGHSGGIRNPGSGHALNASGSAGGRQRIVREKGKKGGCVKEIIDPARFVKKAVIVEKTEYVSTHKFSDFGLNERILKNIEAKGYVTPSPIQDKSIGFVMEGKDVVGIANTGTGKTAAFALPMVHRLIHDMTAKALILAPTRELAQQIQEEIISFSKNCGIRTVLIIGGNSINVQTRDLAKNPRIVIGTPGRLKDHINQGTLDLSGMTYTVLDEVDRMLDMGFIRDIRAIFSHVPKVRQSVFFSATIDREVERLILDFAKDPVTVSLRENVTADGVDQDVVWYRDNDDRIEKLHDLLIKGCEKTIIFDDTKRAVEKLGKELKKRGFRVDQIHGDKSQGQRTRAIRRLKEDEIDVLVATDVAARGIDVSDISHVINYSQPVTYEDYVHRIGRTGRAGKTGQAYTFLQKA